MSFARNKLVDVHYLEVLKRLEGLHPDIDFDIKTNIKAKDYFGCFCKQCGHSWTSNYSNSFTLKRGCPQCASIKGEQYEKQS